MNIGIIHGFVGGGGGTEETLNAILDTLEKTDHSVTLYTFSKPKIKSKKIRIKTILPITIPFFGLYQRVMESKLIAKAKNEDILIQASGGLCIPVNPNQKIIVYCHSDFSNDLENKSTKYKGIWSLYYKPYHNMMKKFVDNLSSSKIFLISNSEFIHNSLKSKYNKNSKIIYPPVNLNEFNSQNKKNQIVSIGRFSKEKNLEFGINVVSQLNSLYYIIGNTKTKSNILYCEKLETQIKKLNLESKIKLLKNINRSDLVNYLNNSKIYFHCSNETFGISVVESIAAGCIPIVPDTSAHKETVQFAELRYKENDENDAKNKIKSALNGEFDHILKPLDNSIKKFSKEKFQQFFLQLIEEFD
ncbi:MAG: glycosyltransferase [Nitrosopumilus sp.]|nr:glycosyltransferase [Nitrosopumilus sp.]MDH3487467.1 glycosyltransferase [Nitrosopumilus sp.]